MKSVIRVVDRWLFEEYRTSSEDLAIFRILFCMYLLMGCLPEGLWVDQLPQAAFSPPISLAALFRHYPPNGVMLGLNVATIIFTCTLMIGWHTVISSFSVAVGMVLIKTICYADSKVDHDILVILVPLTLAAFWLGTKVFTGWLVATVERSGRKFINRGFAPCWHCSSGLAS